MIKSLLLCGACLALPVLANPKDRGSKAQVPNDTRATATRLDLVGAEDCRSTRGNTGDASPSIA